jgi:hypothetical protein
MALVTLSRAGQAAGLPVVSGTVWLPRSGAWVAELQVDGRENVTGAVDLRISQARTMRGTVSRGALVEGSVRLRVAAGAAGLEKAVSPKHYTTPSLRVVLLDILKEAGETLSATAEAVIMNQVLEHWTLRRMSAARAIAALLERAPADAVWRVLDDGSVWVGRDTWASIAADAAEVAELPEHREVELALYQPDVRPGTTLNGRRVDSAEVRIMGASVRATVWTE